MQVLVSSLLLSRALGLILIDTSSILPVIDIFDHVTASFGVQSNEDSYQRTAPLVLIDPCVVPTDELAGVIVLVGANGTCSFFEQAWIVAELGGVGLVLGLMEGADPWQMWKDETDDRDVEIPCVSITSASFTEVEQLLVNQYIATISKIGEVSLSHKSGIPVTQITDLIIFIPFIWGIVAVKCVVHRCNTRNRARRTQRIRERRTLDIPEIFFTNDLLYINEDEKCVSYMTNDCCPICLENFEQQMKVMRLPCGHGYHRDCIMPWMADHNRDSCPFCRQTISDKLNEINPPGGSTCCYRAQDLLSDEEDVAVVQLSSLENDSEVSSDLDIRNHDEQVVQLSSVENDSEANSDLDIRNHDDRVVEMVSVV